LQKNSTRLPVASHVKVLVDPGRRKLYDTKGKGEFAEHFPKASANDGTGASEDGEESEGDKEHDDFAPEREGVVVRMSPVNKALVTDWMNKAAMRELYHGPPSRRDVAARGMSLIPVPGAPGNHSVHPFTSFTCFTCLMR